MDYLNQINKRKVIKPKRVEAIRMWCEALSVVLLIWGGLVLILI